jgi:hypothetical protein
MSLKRHHPRIAVALAILAPLVAPSTARAAVCTEVIGFSQTLEWYLEAGAFEGAVENERWQVRARSGASVEMWADPTFDGWTLAPSSPCVTASDAPDRVVLTISGSHGADEDAWAESIERAVATVMARHPSAVEVLLQPVVGGPGHADCFFEGALVRASWQHEHIDHAIARVVGGPVAAGMSPEVERCEDYRDESGHLTPSASATTGARIGTFYRALDPTTTTAPGGGTSTTTTFSGPTTSTTSPPSGCTTSTVECALDDAQRLIAELGCPARCRCDALARKTTKLERRLAQAAASAMAARCRRKLGRASAALANLDTRLARLATAACIESDAMANALRQVVTVLHAELTLRRDGGFCARGETDSP